MIRIGKPARDFISELIKDDGICLLTRSTGTQEDYGSWSRALQALGLVPDGKSIASTCKYQFYREYFSIIEMRDVNGDLLGYYCLSSTKSRSKFLDSRRRESLITCSERASGIRPPRW